MIHCMIDTDVILDLYLKRELFYKESEKIFAHLYYKSIKGYTTALALSNIQYIIRKQVGKTDTLNLLKQLMKLVKVVNMDEKTVQTALASEFTDFEDALQNYSAEQYTAITHIVTRNVTDYKKSKLIVLKPIEFLQLI